MLASSLSLSKSRVCLRKQSGLCFRALVQQAISECLPILLNSCKHSEPSSYFLGYLCFCTLCFASVFVPWQYQMLGSETVFSCALHTDKSSWSRTPGWNGIVCSSRIPPVTLHISLLVLDGNYTGKGGIQEQAGTAGTGLSTPRRIPCPVLWKVLAALAALTAC